MQQYDVVVAENRTPYLPSVEAGYEIKWQPNNKHNLATFLS